MIFKRWNSWTSKIPFDKTDAAETLGIELCLDKTGDGEEKFADQIGGRRLEEDGYDVVGPFGVRYEVKRVTTTGKKCRVFRSTITKGSFRDFKNKVQTAAMELELAISLLRSDVEFPMGHDLFMKTFEDVCEKIMKGNIGRRTLFGFHTKSGMKEYGFIHLLHDVLIVMRSYEAKRIERIPLVVGGAFIENLTTSQYLKICDIAGIIGESMHIGPLHSLFVHLNDELFEKPRLLYELWSTLSPAELIGSKADVLVIVDESMGFFPIEAEDIDKYIDFVGITFNKEARFIANKEVF